MHILLWSFDDFPQLLLHPYRNLENKNSSYKQHPVFLLSLWEAAWSKFQGAVSDWKEATQNHIILVLQNIAHLLQTVRSIHNVSHEIWRLFEMQ